MLIILNTNDPLIYGEFDTGYPSKVNGNLQVNPAVWICFPFVDGLGVKYYHHGNGAVIWQTLIQPMTRRMALLNRE
jgi:hypothetical protein